MKTRNEIYNKFGLAAEAAQLLETEIGNLLIENEASDKNLFENIDRLKAQEIIDKINKSTLGQLVRKLTQNKSSEQETLHLLEIALKSRNRLIHSFFREHNIRLNSDEGRLTMFNDLGNIHSDIFTAYKRLMCIQGIDLDKLTIDIPPDDKPKPGISTKHFKI